MLRRTIIILGPGGTGKSPLGTLFKDQVHSLQPYRLRFAGPGDKNDLYYAPPGLAAELRAILVKLGDRARRFADGPMAIKWYAMSQVLFFRVRQNQQILIMNHDYETAWAEIFAPIVVMFLETPDLCKHFGQIQTLILNPGSRSAGSIRNFTELITTTELNCRLRGDSEASILERVSSIPGGHCLANTAGKTNSHRIYHLAISRIPVSATGCRD